MERSSMPIGVFDSGVGGLTVVKCLTERLPDEKIIYFGDTKRVPYGCRTPEEITLFSLEIADFLMAKNVKAIIAACNTISVTCLAELTERVPVPVFGMLEPAADALSNLARHTPIRKAGVIGTARTVASGKYVELLNKKMPSVEILAKACPKFVTFVEEGTLFGEGIRDTTSEYLKEFIEAGIDALILGCTHFPLLHAEISSFLGNDIKLINPAERLADNVFHYLEANGLKNTLAKRKEPVFYLSSSAGKFEVVSKAAFGVQYTPVIFELNG